MSRIHALYQLQSLDSKIDNAKKELAEVEAQLGESAALKAARSRFETAGKDLRKVQTTQKDLELEVKTLSDKIATQEKMLYSGKAMSAKEAANLQDEVESLKRWHHTREELLLEKMVETEEKEEVLEQTQVDLAQIEEAWQANEEKLRQRQAMLKAEIAALQDQRPSMTGKIDPEDLSAYEDLRPKKAGVAVAAVKDNMCQACFMIPSNIKIQRARGETELVYCGACGRILYVL